MAITNPTRLSDFSGFLTAEQSAPIFDKARRRSVVQQLARQIPLGPTGVNVPVTTGKPTAGWVAEGGQKPASQGSMSLVNLQPKKIAAIAVVSEEVLRVDPGGYVSRLQDDFAEAFAMAFDDAALHGASTPFANYIDQTTKTVALGSSAGSAGGAYIDLNKGLDLLVTAGKRLTGFALDIVTEPTLNASVDTTGRPLFVDSPLTETAGPVRAGRVLGRPAFMGEGVKAVTPGTASTAYNVGYAGDWDQVVWGQVGGISYRTSTEATVTINGTLTSLWEKNLVAVLAEAEYGFYCNDVAAFVEFTKTTPA